MKEIKYNGKDRKIYLTIGDDYVAINIYNGISADPIPVVDWHIEEVEEDADVAITIATAINLFHTNPQKLVDLLL